jgi:stage II sporulation protein D
VSVSPGNALHQSIRSHTAPSLLVGAFLLVVAVGLPGCTWIEGTLRGGTHAPLGGESPPPAERLPEAGLPAGGPLIRVGLAHNVESAEVSCAGGLSVTVFADSVWTERSPDASRWRFRAIEGGIEAIGPWGAIPGPAGTVRIAPDGSAPVSFGGTPYRGEIEIFSAAPGSLSVGNILSVESYLLGVVPLEIGRRPPGEVEAVKAQAVAARTYAVAASGSRASGSFDVFPTVEDQVYGGIDAEEPVSRLAILETAGIIAEHGGEPITSYFHSCCGGRTEAREETWELPGLPYLRSVRDTPGGSPDLALSYCRDAADFTWTETWTGPEIAELVERHLPAVASTPVGQPVGRVRDLRVTARTPSGRSRWLTVETDGGTYRVFGDRARWLLRRPGTGRILRSSWFELDVDRRGGRVARVVARGRGHGHGVGMCQHGALGMAREGYTYDEILKHYYGGVGLVRAYSVGARESSGDRYGPGGEADPPRENEIDSPQRR